MLYNNNNIELLETLNSLLDENKKWFTKKAKFETSSENTLEIPVFEVLGSVPIGYLKSKYNYFILLCTSLPGDLNLYHEDIKTFLNPLLIKNHEIINNLTFMITYKIPFNIGKNLGMVPFRSFGQDSINDITYDVKKKKYINNIELVDLRLDGIKETEHAHECGIEYLKYETNGKFKECFYKHIRSKYEMTEKEIDYIKSEIMLVKSDNKDSRSKMLNVFKMSKFIEMKEEEADKKSKGFNILENLDERLINLIMNVGEKQSEMALKELEEVDETFFKKSDTWSRSKGEKNSYSPFDRNSFIYKNLNTFFKRYTDKYINVGLSLTQKNKNKLLRELESQRLLYNEMHSKVLIKTDDIKRIRLFISWIKKLIISCVPNEDDDDSFCFFDLLKELDEELTGEIDMEKMLSSDDEEPFYV